MSDYKDALAALGPLRVRVHQLQLQASREHEAAVQRWQQSEKPVLKEHAAGMKETLAVLAREEAALRRRVDGFAASSVPNHPGTSTGFNVIRARVDACGQPLATDALRAERDRLVKTIDILEVEVASAKAEIMQHRRHEELDIWETKLVALQVRHITPPPAAPPAASPASFSSYTPLLAVDISITSHRVCRTPRGCTVTK